MMFRLDAGVLAKDAQECEDNKSYIICDNMSSKITSRLNSLVADKSFVFLSHV